MDFERAQAEVLRLHRAGAWQEALAVVDRLGSEHAAKAAFWTACLRARAGDRDGALAALEEAVAAGHWFAAAALGDDDLAAVRDDPRFATLVVASAANRQRSATANYDLVPREPLEVVPDGRVRGTLVAFRRASGSPLGLARTGRPPWPAGGGCCCRGPSTSSVRAWRAPVRRRPPPRR